MYKYIVFDFDGTLINSNYLIDLTLKETSRQVLGKEIKQEVIDDVWGKVLYEQMKTLDSSRIEELSKFYSEFYRENRDEHTTIFDGVKEMLDKLVKHGYRLSIVTNKGNSGLEHGLEMFGIKEYFDICLAKDDVEMKKPHPEGLYKVMDFYNAKADEMLFVGDSIHDIACGKNANIDTVLVNWTVINLEVLMKENPTYLINSPDELLSILYK